MSKIPYSTETLGPRFSDLVKLELEPRFSRMTGTLAPHEHALPFGSVLGKDDNGKFVALADMIKATASPASEGQGETESADTASATAVAAKACAVLAAEAPASAEDADALILRGYCILNSAALNCGSLDKAAVKVALEAKTFILEDVED